MVAPLTAVVPALEDPTARKVALVQVALELCVEIGSEGVTSLGGLGGGGALEGGKGGKRTTDASTLVSSAGTKGLAGLVAEDGFARGRVAVGEAMRENGVAAGGLVFRSTAATGAFDLFGAGWAGIPVADRLAEMAAWEGFGAGRSTRGERR